MAVETPKFTVLEQLDEGLELREYPAYVVAETEVEGEQSEVGNELAQTADIGLVCRTCGRRVLLPRRDFARGVKRFIQRAGPADDANDNVGA